MYYPQLFHCADSFEDAEEYIAQEGNVAKDCSTLPDDDLAKKDMNTIHNEKRKPVKSKRFSDKDFVNKRYEITFMF